MNFKKATFLALFILLIPSLVLAIKIVNPLSAESFEELVQNLIDLIFWIAIVLSPLMILIAGFYFLTAAGNPQKIKTAKSIIFWTIIGVTIVLLAKGVISVVKQILGG